MAARPSRQTEFNFRLLLLLLFSFSPPLPSANVNCSSAVARLAPQMKTCRSRSKGTARSRSRAAYRDERDDASQKLWRDGESSSSAYFFFVSLFPAVRYIGFNETRIDSEKLPLKTITRPCAHVLIYSSYYLLKKTSRIIKMYVCFNLQSFNLQIVISVLYFVRSRSEV